MSSSSSWVEEEESQSKSSSIIVEHVVLFSIREGDGHGDDDDDPSKVNDMVNGLNGLNSLDSVLYLTAGPIFRTRSCPPSMKWTHMLHARYLSKSHLSSYSSDPAHVSVVETLVKPICDDVMALDWLAHESTSTSGSLVPRPGSALQLTIFNLNEYESKEVMAEGMEKIKAAQSGRDGPIEQFTYGENFSPERSKGYGFASLAVFPDLNELDACEEYEDQMKSIVDKLSLSHSLISLDYLLPRPSPPL